MLWRSRLASRLPKKLIVRVGGSGGYGAEGGGYQVPEDQTLFGRLAQWIPIHEGTKDQVCLFLSNVRKKNLPNLSATVEQGSIRLAPSQTTPFASS